MLKIFLQRETTSEQFPDLSGLLEKQYNHQVAQNHIQHDPGAIYRFTTITIAVGQHIGNRHL
jgi:hypothetical protein